MSQFIQWLNMGGYAMYIWPAYGLVFVVLVVNILTIKWQRKRTCKFLHAWCKRQ